MSWKTDAPEMINLSMGHPTEALYAYPELANAARAAAARMDAATFSLDYGEEGCSARFASALGELLAEEDGAATAPTAPDAAFDLTERLFVTNGVSHALDVISAVFARPGDRCLTEAATYFLAVDVFRAHGLIVDAAPAAADGSLDVDALDAMLRGGAPPPQLLYVMPIHANPTGNTMSVTERARLVNLAIEFSFFIVADEVYHFLDWPSKPGSIKPARIAAFDPAHLSGRPDGETGALTSVYSSSAKMASEGDGSRSHAPQAGRNGGGVVLSVSSFSKILGAGLRIGWVEAAPDVIDHLRGHPYVMSGGGVAPFVEQFVCEVIESGDQRAFIVRLLDIYREGLEVLTKVLRQYEADCGWSVTSPQPKISAKQTLGGFFVWLQLPPPLLARDVIATAEAHHNVTAMIGERCCPTFGAGELLRDRLRLCFAFLPKNKLEEGVHRLARAVLLERAKATTHSSL